MENKLQEICNILKDINPIDALNILEESKENIINMNWINFNISKGIFYTFKDTVYYNFEHLNNSSINFGKFKFNNFGTTFPKLMFSFNSDNIINKNELTLLLEELKILEGKWNKQIYIANLLFNNVEISKDSDIIIYDKNSQTPQAWGYKSNVYSPILDSYGDKINNKNNTILCPVRKIDEYSEYPLLLNCLKDLKKYCEMAIKENKGLLINFEDCNFENYDF
jgi:hypothetical protein